MSAAERQQQIEQQLRERPPGGSLPNLVEEPHWSQNWSKMIEEWLQKMMPNTRLNFSSDAYSLFGTILYYFAIFLLVAITAWIILKIYRRLQGYTPQLKRLPSQLGSIPGPTESEQLQAALTAGQWGKAMRLRWQICLERLRQPPSLTLYEAGMSAALPGEQLTGYLRGMFRPGDGTQQLYQELDSTCAGFERGGAS